MEKEQAKKAHDLFSEIERCKTLEIEYKEMSDLQLCNRDNYLFFVGLLMKFRAPLIEAMKSHIESLEKQLEQL